MELDTLSIGTRIRKRREELHLTREQLSEMLDVTPKFCCDIETGAKGMSLKTLILISKTLYLSTDYILFGNDNSPTSFTMFAQEIPATQSTYYLRICREICELTNSVNEMTTTNDSSSESNQI